MVVRERCRVERRRGATKATARAVNGVGYGVASAEGGRGNTLYEDGSAACDHCCFDADCEVPSGLTSVVAAPLHMRSSSRGDMTGKEVRPVASMAWI